MQIMSICKQEAAFNGWSFCILIQSSQSDGIRSIESSEYLSSTQTFVHRKTAVTDTFFLSSLAQQESQSISQNVRMGFQYRMQEGKGYLNTERFLGLTKGDSKYDFVIVPEEAETVRRIYREFLDGCSPAMIANHLEGEGILTPAKRKKWYPATVLSILSNEKYCGDMLLQKTFVEDYLTHKTVKNTGQLPQYYVEDHHDLIVPKECTSRCRERS